MADGFTSFMSEMRSLEDAYLARSTPEERSGFGGGRERWVRERSPLVEAIHRDGDFLDVGCANGLLAADVVAWAGRRGHKIVPHGIDLGERLVALARGRHPGHTAHFVAADLWAWEPDRTWDFVYVVVDLAPHEVRCALLERLRDWVAPGGRLVIGAYGSRSRSTDPEPVADVMRACGFEVVGESADDPDQPLTRFAWSESRAGATESD